METVIKWMLASPLHTLINSNGWVWPAMEILHFIGLCLLLGSLLIVDLRVAGFAPRVPLKPVGKFITVTLVGFTINLMTGIGFLFSDPNRYVINIAFRAKMLLIVMCGLNALYFALRVRPKIREQGNALVLQKDAKLVACLSLILWTSVIVLGRLIPYFE